MRRTKRRRTDQIYSDDEDDDDVDHPNQGRERRVANQSLAESLQMEQPAVGIIEKVELTNFLCHSVFTCRPGGHVNFIVGPNGSGKSAVLTSVVVALGGKANLTNRGSSIKELIKTGKSEAKVAVTLRNKGDDPYKPHEYGDSITVERRMTSDGTSSYRIKNQHNKVISHKREELDLILDQFNIQVDNPVSILNQDTSRNFLFSKSPQDKYKFFLKATQLEQMEQDYLCANEARQVSKDIMTQKQEALPILEKEVHELEQKCKAIKSLEKLKEKVRKLKHEMAWAYIIQEEQVNAQKEREIDKERVVMAKAVKRLQDAEAGVRAQQEHLAKIQKDTEEIRQAAEQAEPKRLAAQAERDQAKRHFRKAQSDCDKLESERRNAVSDRDQLLQRIKDLRSNASENLEAEKRAREARIGELQEKQSQLSATLKTTEYSAQQFHAAVTKLKNDIYNLRSEESGVRRNLDESRRRIQELEAARKDHLKKFGAHIPDLMRKIQENRNRFHQLPRGPIGSYLTLRDSSLCLAVERCLASLVHAFCVTDLHDERELNKIISENLPQGKPRPVIITSQFEKSVYDVSKEKPRSQYPTVLDILKINDPVVANCLVDQRGIESILLIKNSEEATRVMKSNPSKVKEAFTQTGDQIFCRPMFRYYSCQENRAKFLTTSLEDSIRACRDDVSRREAEHQLALSKVNRADTEVRQNQQEQRKCETQISRLRSQLSTVKMELDELRSIEDPDPVDVATLEEEVEHYNASLTDIDGKMETFSQTLSQAQDDKTKAEKQFDCLDKQNKTIASKIDVLRGKLAHAENEFESYKSKKKVCQQKKAVFERKIQEMTQSLEEDKLKQQEVISKAEEVCERVNTRRKPTDIETEIHQIEKRLQEETELRGNEDEIMKKYHSSYETYRKIKTEIEQIINFLQKLKQCLARRSERYEEFFRNISARIMTIFTTTLNDRGLVGEVKILRKRTAIELYALDGKMLQRRKRYFEFRRMIALRCRYFFVILLNNRNYSGKINFNHEKKTLDLEVKTNSAQREASKDLRALSGGERSFATVCFILALWDTMESPFRFLDEFDVFMDMVNRRVSMDMMMAVAKQRPYNQFIFLTPQDMSQMKAIPTACILQMRKPERGQTALPYRPVTDEDMEEETDN